jgi:hypothetical protein
MTCPTSMMLTAVARLTDARLPGAMGNLPGLVPGAASTSRSLFAVDVEPGRRYPVFRSATEFLNFASTFTLGGATAFH